MAEAIAVEDGLHTDQCIDGCSGLWRFEVIAAAHCLAIVYNVTPAALPRHAPLHMWTATKEVKRFGYERRIQAVIVIQIRNEISARGFQPPVPRVTQAKTMRNVIDFVVCEIDHVVVQHCLMNDLSSSWA